MSRVILLMTEFKLKEVEEKRADDFKQWHKRCRPKPHYTLRQYAPFKYIFTPTGIGSSVDIVCPYCGKVKNITDVDSW